MVGRLNPAGLGSPENGKIASDHAPTDPTLEAVQAVCQTATEIMSALEDTDATFNTCMS